MEIRKYGDRTAVKLVCPEQGRTQQSFKEECDINNVIAMHNRTGSLQHVNNAMPTFGDYSNVGTYQEALDTVILAQESFDGLPAKLRNKFMNNPALLLEFLDKAENLEEARSLGLAETPAMVIDGTEVFPATYEPWTRPEPGHKPSDPRPAADPPADPPSEGESPPI